MTTLFVIAFPVLFAYITLLSLWGSPHRCELWWKHGDLTALTISLLFPFSKLVARIYLPNISLHLWIRSIWYANLGHVWQLVLFVMSCLMNGLHHGGVAMYQAYKEYTSKGIWFELNAECGCTFLLYCRAAGWALSKWGLPRYLTW